jgi:hypothetical protein
MLREFYWNGLAFPGSSISTRYVRFSANDLKLTLNLNLNLKLNFEPEPESETSIILL